jgi:diadenosine tetraphosphatase ApaH/serine/threonine PP2A family protein phosphatase
MSPHRSNTVDPDLGKPLRIALISDVHGNLPALQAVLDDVAEAGVDETWCLGDLVGYGAQPDECVALAREACEVCLVGNHDLVVLDKLDINTFSLNAALAARWTQERIGAEALDFLSKLEPADAEREIGLFHASPRDPVWEYVLSTLQADACIDAMDPRAAAIGHSHVALFFTRPDDGEVRGEPAPAGTELDLSTGRWLINPGAVGQPRDGDPRAAWLLLDLGSWTAQWRRVEYPIAEAAQAIERAGLPPALAERLYRGE